MSLASDDEVELPFFFVAPPDPEELLLVTFAFGVPLILAPRAFGGLISRPRTFPLIVVGAGKEDSVSS